MLSELTPSDLTGPQRQAVRALLSGASPGEVARTCGVSERTLRSWRQLPAFQAALHQGQARLLDEVHLQLALAAATAVRTLVEVSQSRDASASVRVAAAGKLLTLLFRETPAFRPRTTSAEPPSPTPTTPHPKPSAVCTPLAAPTYDRSPLSADSATPTPNALPTPPGAPPAAYPFPDRPNPLRSTLLGLPVTFTRDLEQPTLFHIGRPRAVPSSRTSLPVTPAPSSPTRGTGSQTRKHRPSP